MLKFNLIKGEHTAIKSEGIIQCGSELDCCMQGRNHHNYSSNVMVVEDPNNVRFVD